MWHKPCRTFHPWCPCIKTRCLLDNTYHNSWPMGIGKTDYWLMLIKWFNQVTILHVTTTPLSWHVKNCDLIGLVFFTLWRHQMETFSALLAICAGNSTVPGEFPAQRPVTRSFDVFFHLRPNKQLSKQWWGWWFETPSWSLWRHRNDMRATRICYTICIVSS